jgi:hypothetical protein
MLLLKMDGNSRKVWRFPFTLPGEPFDHKKRAHTALVHEKIFSRPYAVFTTIRIAVYNFTFFTVFQGHSTFFHGQMHTFSRPNLVFTAIS